MATYYIATTGNDTTGNGSSGNPWATLSKFISSSTSGDTCIVNDGTYNLTASVSFVGASNRTIQAANTGGATFDAGGNNIQFVLSGDQSFTGLVFTNFGTAQYDSHFSGVGFLGAVTGNISFDKCTFSDMAVVNSNSGGGVFSIGISNTTFTLDNCTIYDIYGPASATHAAIFKASQSGGVYTVKNSTIVSSISGVTALNGLMCIQSSGNISTFTITNTIVSNSSGATFAMSTRNAPTTQTYSYSDFHNMTAGTASLSGTNIITGDPLFIDAANNNFNLRPTSPCIDAGVIV